MRGVDIILAHGLFHILKDKNLFIQLTVLLSVCPSVYVSVLYLVDIQSVQEHWRVLVRHHVTNEALTAENKTGLWIQCFSQIRTLN